MLHLPHSTELKICAYGGRIQHIKLVLLRWSLEWAHYSSQSLVHNLSA